MLVVETIARIRREHFIKGKTIKESAFDRKEPPKPRIDRQLTTFWTTRSRPRILIRKYRSVAIIAAIAPHFAAHRRGGAAK